MPVKKNHLRQMELNRKNLLAAGLMRDRFPGVSGIVIHMVYYRKRQSSVLMERTVNFYPSGYAYFNMRCMAKGCEDGGFNLAPVIKGLVRDGKRIAKGFLSCHGAEEGHASVEYNVRISYSHDGPAPGRTRRTARQLVAK